MTSAYNRTALFNQVQPGGVHSIADVTQHPGNIWFVDSGETVRGGDTTGHGKNPDSPFLTIDYAVGRCTANNGDVIYVMPGHAENVTAGSIDLDVQGISVIGLGIGDDRPTLTFTATDSDIDVDDCDILFKNFRIVQGIDAVVAIFDVNADDFTLEDIDFVEAAAAQAVCFVDVDGGGANACDNFAMRRCRAIQTAAGADQVVDIAQVQDGIIIEDNYMDVDCENACLYSPAIFTDILVKNNVLHNRQTGDHAIEFAAAGTGHIVNNALCGDTAGIILDPGSCFCAGNTETVAIDSPGYATPVAITDNAGNILGADNNNNTFASTNVARNEDGSIIERLEDLKADLSGTAGIAAFPAAAKAANAVSLAEVLRHVDDAQEQCIVKADGAVLGAADALFTITGGPILVTSFLGLVTTQIGAGASTCQIVEAVTTPAGNVNLSTAVDIDADAAGTSYHMTVATPGVFTPTTAGAFDQVPAISWFCPIGTINATTSVARAGVIAWYMTYKPLSPTSVVVAAA